MNKLQALLKQDYKFYNLVLDIKFIYLIMEFIVTKSL